MSGLSQAVAAAGRGAAWLLPARQRGWVAAIWAEAHEVPPGLPRLAWRAGGIWMVAREVLMPRRVVKVALFAAAAAVAAWAAWPQPTMGHAAVSRFGVITTVLLLAGLPLLARRFLGPASPSRAGRALRVFCCAASLRIDQGIAAGVLATVTGALFVAALGTSTVALMLKSAGLRHWLSHGQQLTAIATYRSEIYAGANVFGYVLIWISFPVIGLIASAAVASVLADTAPPEPSPGSVQEP